MTATPPAACRSVATKRPPGFRSTMIGVRSAIASKSSSLRPMPSSAAMASRCSTALVEPPLAATPAMALSMASRVMICDGRTSSRTSRIATRPASAAASDLSGSRAGMPLRPAGLMPRSSIAIDMVLAVNCPPQAPAPGHATSSRAWTSSGPTVPAAWAPTTSKTSWMVTSRPL